MRSRRLTCGVYIKRIPCPLVPCWAWPVGAIDQRWEGRGWDVYSASSPTAGLMDGPGSNPRPSPSYSPPLGSGCYSPLSPTAWRVIVPLNSGVYPLWVGLDQCHGWEDLCLWSGGWSWILFVKCNAVSDSMFLGIYRLRMALGSLSTNGQCCVSVLLMFCHKASSTGACWPLGGVCC